MRKPEARSRPGSTEAITMPEGGVKGAGGVRCMTVCMTVAQIGSAARVPVSPKGVPSSMPTQTPITMSGV
ncbi:MAG: hypothetical protein ACXU9M_09455 [Thermodesulfobacteriota bacterium]